MIHKNKENEKYSSIYLLDTNRLSIIKMPLCRNFMVGSPKSFPLMWDYLFLRVVDISCIIGFKSSFLGCPFLFLLIFFLSLCLTTLVRFIGRRKSCLSLQRNRAIVWYICNGGNSCPCGSPLGLFQFDWIDNLYYNL